MALPCPWNQVAVEEVEDLSFQTRQASEVEAGHPSYQALGVGEAHPSSLLRQGVAAVAVEQPFSLMHLAMVEVPGELLSCCQEEEEAEVGELLSSW